MDISSAPAEFWRWQHKVKQLNLLMMVKRVFKQCLRFVHHILYIEYEM